VEADPSVLFLASYITILIHAPCTSYYKRKVLFIKQKAASVLYDTFHEPVMDDHGIAFATGL
jgi:hypothetical protein